MPDKSNIKGQLAILCRGSPKIRATIRIIAELVILGGKKVTFFCSLPANQLLLYAIFQAMGVKAALFTADCNREQRDEHVTAFTEDPEVMGFLGSYYVGSFGLDLPDMCNHHCEWDAPPSIGHKQQAQGRTRRIRQQYTVEAYEVIVENSFQSRVINSTLCKAIPGAMAELDISIKDGPARTDIDDTYLDIGEWILHDDGYPVQAPPGNTKPLLSPEEFVAALLDSKSGKKSELKTHPDEIWEVEEVEDELLHLT